MMDNFTASFYQNFIEDDRWKYITDGLFNTLRITFFAVLIGIFLGFLIAVVRSTYDKTHKLGVLNALCKVYLTVIRGTPVLVQLLIIYFVVFGSVKIDKTLVAVIAFGINSGAYVAEIFRSGIMSIDDGQFEAGRSLGFNYTQTMIYIILGLGLNVVVGLSGLLVLGYGGFYAIGAYTFALLNHYYGLGFWTCLPIAGLMAAAAGFLLGFPVLPLRGDYLAIVTLGFGEIVRILLLNNTEITGGPNGISQIPKPTLFGLEFSRTAREGGWDTFSNFFGLKYDPSDRVIFLYLVALLLVVLSLFVINRLLRMPLGRAWEALREDEIACRSLGLSPRRIKLTAFTISAAFAGFAGTLFAARQGFVSPESFTFAESAFVLAIVVLGGMGSQFAVILAAILLVVSRELMRDFNEYSMLMLGGLMVLMMIWRPQGLLPMTRPQLKLKNGAAKGEQA